MGQSVGRSNGGKSNGSVIFSFVDGYVWASWPGSDSIVRMGRYDIVIASMQDFLAQDELAERLANGGVRSTGPVPPGEASAFR